MKEYIEKLEKESAKMVTKNLHSTTAAMGKAPKTLADAPEAKRQHRSRWAAHISEAIKTWESQLHDFRRQQASFQEVVGKARVDIETYKSTIQNLTTRVSQATLASMPPMVPTVPEDQEVENEEERWQSQRQSALKACAESLGIYAGSAAPQEGQLQQQGMEDLEFVDAEAKSKKPPRALEPFGGLSSVAPSEAKNQ